MKVLKRDRKLSSSFLNYALLFSSLLIVVLGLVFVIIEVNTFQKEAESLRNKSLSEKKQQVRNEVEKIVDYIDFSRSMLETRMQNQIKGRVYEAWEIMDNLYNHYKETKSQDEIKKIVREALRPIRFNNDRGYYFIVSLNGVEELYPPHPELEGKNLMSLQDEKGNFVIKDELKVIQDKDEGFVTDYWKKPGSVGEMVYPKTSYVKVFKPLDWYVGAGEYLDNIQIDMQQDVIAKIKQTSYGKEGYIFVNTYDGVAVVIDSDVFTAGDTVWNVSDPTGLKVIQEERKAVQNPNGDFIKYHWKKKTTNEISPKISFIKGIEDWQWMIGAGVYIDEIEGEIAKKRSKLYNRLLNELVFLSFLLLISVMVIYTMARYLSRKIGFNFTLFKEKLTDAVNSGRKIKVDDFNIVEVQNIIGPINRVISSHKSTERKLRDSEIRFRTIFETAPVMFIVLDEQMNFKLSNKAIEEVFTFTPGKKISKIEILRRLRNSEVNKNFVVNLEKFDGQFREIEVETNSGLKKQNWAAFKTENNEIIYVGYDITTIRKHQEDLKAVNKTKDKVLSIISHDMHGPFNSIIGFSRLLLYNFDELSKAKRERYLLHVYRSSQGVHSMLQNMLSWARAQSGSIKPKKLPILVHMLIDEVFKTLQPIADTKSIKLINNIGTEAEIISDSSLLRIVIQNFIANSIKFTQEGGQVECLICDSSKSYLCLGIADSGIGMSLEDIDSFEKGLEIESRKGTLNESGTGLGLLICKDFIKMLGGHFRIQSSPGKGTSINIYLNRGQ